MPLTDDRFKPAVRALVHELVTGNYDGLEADGRVSLASADGLRRTVEEYAGTLVDLPDEAFDWTNVYQYKGAEDAWRLEVPMYTEEVGQCDLTLILDAEGRDGDVDVKIRDLLVQ